MREITDGMAGKVKITHVPEPSRATVMSILSNEYGIRLPDSLVGDDKFWELCNEHGKFVKRFSRVMKELTGDRPPNDLLGRIGDIVTPLPPNHRCTYDIVSKFDWEAGDFGDYGSCFWGSRSAARKIMEINGFHALRIYINDAGFARAWIAPFGEEYIIFNAYGLRLDVMGYILKQITGARYMKSICLYSDVETVYVNSEEGIVVGDDKIKYGSTCLPISAIVCSYCGDTVGLWCHVEEGALCEECFYDLFLYCEDCGGTIESGYETCVNTSGGDVISVCSSCASRYPVCDICDERYDPDILCSVEDTNSVDVCENCIYDVNKCAWCERLYYYHDSGRMIEGEWICNECIDEYENEEGE